MHLSIGLGILGAFIWMILKMIVSKLKGNVHTRPPYPPGPKPKPLIGNAFDFPLVEAHKVFLDMSKEYGNLLHFEALGKHIIILNSLEDAEELLERRAGNYSDRPVLPIIKSMGWNYNIGLLYYGDEWRYHKRLFQQHLRRQVADKFIPVQIEKARVLLQGLLTNPEDFEKHYKKYAISIPLSTMFGYDLESVDDPVIIAADQSVALGGLLLQPGRLINMFPALLHLPSWLPGAGSLRLAAEIKRLTGEMKRIPMEHVNRQLAEGTARPSLMAKTLEKKARLELSEKEEKATEDIAFTVYAAASDTTISMTGSFIYLMLKHPEAQRKAQAELDAHLASKRLPDLNDRTSGKLPYIEAIYREIMRLGPPLPLCAAHSTIEDDIYKGYFIPKGSIIMTNLWGIGRNEKKYSDPFTFNPDRFFDETGKLNDDDRILAYGFGRRICSGKHMASSTLWLMIASVLACFNIEKATDEFGNEVEINEGYEEDGLTRHKIPFECSIKVRSPAARKLIVDTN